MNQKSEKIRLIEKIDKVAELINQNEFAKAYRLWSGGCSYCTRYYEHILNVENKCDRCPVKTSLNVECFNHVDFIKLKECLLYRDKNNIDNAIMRVRQHIERLPD
jgi:hypothetical protein